MLRRSLIFGAGSALAACATREPTPPSTPTLPRQPRIGLALGGGGTKGFAHVGVIKALEAQSLAPQVIAGTSAGSVVGALYASGLNGFALQELAFALDEAKVKDLNLRSPWEGLLIGQKLQDYVNELVKGRPLEQLGKPFAAVATHGGTGRRVDFARGNTGQAVRASSSFPLFFKPTLIDGQTYVQRLGEQELARADVVIRPQVGRIGAADFNQKEKAILEGERAVASAMPELRRAIQTWQASHG